MQAIVLLQIHTCTFVYACMLCVHVCAHTCTCGMHVLYIILTHIMYDVQVYERVYMYIYPTLCCVCVYLFAEFVHPVHVLGGVVLECCDWLAILEMHQLTQLARW